MLLRHLKLPYLSFSSSSKAPMPTPLEFIRSELQTKKPDPRKPSRLRFREQRHFFPTSAALAAEEPGSKAVAGLPSSGLRLQRVCNSTGTAALGLRSALLQSSKRQGRISSQRGSLGPPGPHGTALAAQRLPELESEPRPPRDLSAGPRPFNEQNFASLSLGLSDPSSARPRNTPLARACGRRPAGLGHS